MKGSVVARFGVLPALGILCVALSSYAQGNQGNEYYPNYPRLGIISIGGDQTYQPSMLPILAKFK